MYSSYILQGLSTSVEKDKSRGVWVVEVEKGTQIKAVYYMFQLHIVAGASTARSVC